MGRWSTDHVRTKDGTNIRFGLCKPESEAMRRAVVFFNGRTEWIEKYDYLPELLQLPSDTGFLTIDHRGQGASDGTRAFIDSYDTFADDGAQVVAHVLGEKVPYVLMSHSMGGLISLYSVLTKKLRPQSLVLSSPLLGLPEKPIPSTIARPLSAVLSLTPLKKLSTGAGQFSKDEFVGNTLTHSKEMYEVILNTPYPLPGVAFGWVNATFKAFEVIFNPEVLKTLTVPVLVLGGQTDEVVDRKAFGSWVDLANRCAKSRVQLVMIPEAKHELLAEAPKYRDDAIEHIRQWFASFLK